jgi:hypothetical protein
VVELLLDVDPLLGVDLLDRGRVREVLDSYQADVRASLNGVRLALAGKTDAALRIVPEIAVRYGLPVVKT